MFTRMLKSFSLIGFFLLALGLAGPQAANGQICQPAPARLVSWWAADGNALDSRNRNNGTLVGNASFAAGRVGQGFNFDGNNDSVQIPHDDNQNINGSFSAEAWIFPRTIANNSPRIFDKEDNAGTRWNMTLSASNDLNVAINGILFASTPDNSIPLNQWSHVAFTYNTTTGELKLFINGSQSAILTGVGGEATNVFTPLVIGDDFVTGTREFDGLIDEAAIYNRALSDAEIDAINDAGTSGKCKPTATVAPTGLVGWWAADGNPDDISGNNNDGTLGSGARFVIGKVGQSFSFDGAGSSVGSAPNTLNSAFGAITIEAWVNPSTHGTDTSGTFGNTVVSNTDGDGFALRLKNGVIQADLRLSGGDVLQTFGSVLPLNQWSHVALTYDGANVRAFLNGVQAGGSFAATGTIRNSANNGVCLMIGNDPAAPCITTNDGFEFAGQVDEVSIYNRALTQDEITSIFNAGGAGKLKETTTTGTVAQVGDVTVTYSSAATRRTHEIPLERADLPPLPPLFRATKLFYDIATDLIPTGAVGLCFNLPSFSDAGRFGRLRVFHLESGVWQDRTTTSDFATRQLCAQVSSLSPFAIADVAPTASDFDGDGKADIAVFRPSEGMWRIINSSDGTIRTQQWGAVGDVIVTSDYDGDLKSDIAVWRPSEGNWYIIQSQTNTVRLVNWGLSTDRPVPADFDGDGKTDVAVWRPAEGNWYIIQSATNSGTVRGWGLNSDIPVPADYDGDSKADIAVYRPTEGNWYIIQSQSGAGRLVNWGGGADRPVPADFDGDGLTDIAVFRPSDRVWFIRHSEGGVTVRHWGEETDKLVPADYDGDGRADIAVFRPSEGNWYIIESGNSSVLRLVNFAQGADDVPVPSTFIPQ